MTKVSTAEKMSTQIKAVINLRFKDITSPLGTLLPFPFPNPQSISTKTRDLWVKNTSKLFLSTGNQSPPANIRDWDLLLSDDGSVENTAPNNSLNEKLSLKVYPPRYQLPLTILTHVETTEEKTSRMESFALGVLIYELLFNTHLFTTDDPHMAAKIAAGQFPEDLYHHKMAERILCTWCPELGKKLLNKPLYQKIKTYAHKHPWHTGTAVVGATIGTVALSLPLALTATGFGAGGVAAGSIAAGVQSSIGLVQAGSIFAWCQSVGAGGGALAVLLGSGYVGIGTAMGATLAGVLDGSKTEEEAEVLKREFLEAWKLDVEAEKLDEKALL